MKETLRYVVTKGKNAGKVLFPHLYADGYFRAHKTNTRKDAKGIRVKSEADLIALVRRGHHVRMSNSLVRHPPSTVKPEIIVK